MSNMNKPLSRFLLPVDGPASFDHTAWLMGMIAARLGDRIEKVSLLHVMEGKYLSTHMANIDVRTSHILESSLFKKLKKQYISEKIEPKLAESKQKLIAEGVKEPVDLLIADGDPVEQIAKTVEEGAYSTIIMERRGYSSVKEVLVGSVTSGLLHRALPATVFLAGSQTEENKDCSTLSCIVPVDGSSHSQAALEEAALFMGQGSSNFKEIVLVHVINIARYGTHVDAGSDPAKAGHALLDKHAEFLISKGTAEENIVKVAKFGHPADVVEEEIKARPCSLVFMGRRGRNTLNELFMGSVTRKIIHRCPDQAIALVTAD